MKRKNYRVLTWMADFRPRNKTIWVILMQNPILISTMLAFLRLDRVCLENVILRSNFKTREFNTREVFYIFGHSF